MRNAYDLVWHSNGHLYVPTNGSASGGNTPATPATAALACTCRVDDAMSGDYTAPSVPGITNVNVAQNDFLFRIDPARSVPGYSGHPNPFRCEWVINGGNPTSGTDPAQVAQYPAGTQPDRNWTGLGLRLRRAPVPQRRHRMDEHRLLRRRAGQAAGHPLQCRRRHRSAHARPGHQERHRRAGHPGATGFADPLDLVADPATGRVYVTEHGGRKITLLRPL